MKQLAKNCNGVGAAQLVKAINPNLINQEKCRGILSMTAVALLGLALAGPVLAAPQSATRNYTFTILDFPGSTGTEVLRFNSQTLVGDFADTDGNTHGWLLSPN